MARSSFVRRIWFRRKRHKFTLSKVTSESISVLQATITVAGKSVTVVDADSTPIVKASIAVVGKSVTELESVAVNKASISVAGKAVTETESTAIAKAAVSVTGKTVTAIDGEVVPVAKASISVAGKTVAGIDSEVIAKAALSVTGKTVTAIDGEVVPVAKASISVAGKTVAGVDSEVVAKATIAVSGKTVTPSDTVPPEVITVNKATIAIGALGGGAVPADLLLHADTDYTDSAGRHTVTAVNSAHIGSTAKFGSGAMQFSSATNDAVVVTGNLSDFNWPGDWSLDCWFYPTSFANNSNIYHSGLNDSFFLWCNSTGRLSVYSVGYGIFPQTSATLALNTWQHIAASHSGTTLRVFVDGVTVLTVDTGSGSIVADSGGVYIGRNPTFQQQSDGFIDEFRTLKGTALWTADFTPPTAPYAGTGGPGTVTVIDTVADVVAVTKASISVAGKTVAPIEIERIATAQASISVAGKAVKETESTAINRATVSVAGRTVTSIDGEVVPVAKASISVAGKAIKEIESIAVAKAAITIVGTPVTAIDGEVIRVDKATLSVTGKPVALLDTDVIPISRATILVSGGIVSVADTSVTPTLPLLAGGGPYYDYDAKARRRAKGLEQAKKRLAELEREAQPKLEKLERKLEKARRSRDSVQVRSLTIELMQLQIQVNIDLDAARRNLERARALLAAVLIEQDEEDAITALLIGQH